MAKNNGIKSLSQHEKELEALVVQSTAQTAQAQRALATRAERQTDLQNRLDAFREKWVTANSKTRRVAVDLGGGGVAQISTELINWGVRALGRWSGNGVLANNVDILQGMPHFLLGLGVYIAEMATRKNGEKAMVSATREVVSEAAKLFSQLGFSNLVRALRVRWSDAKDMQINYSALQAEKAALLAQLQKKPQGGIP